MFYSHEVLTSRQYGVATIWLVATLGSKSTLRKVNRKAILEVDVAKACETIVSPEAPMALRLQSNLLYGVARVHNEQCTYVLVDAQEAQNKIRTLLRTIKVVEIEGKHTARPDQLVLREDSQFLLENLINFDFDDVDLTSSGSSDLESLLSPHHSMSSGLGSEHDDPSIGGIVLPPSVSSSLGGPGGFSIGGSVHGESGRGSLFRSSQFRREEDDKLIDPGFEWDDNLGEFVDTHGDNAQEAAAIHQDLPTLRDPTVLADDNGADDHAQEPVDEVLYQDDDDMLRPPDDDADMYADAEAFPTRPRQSSQPSSPPAHQRSHTAEPVEPASDAVDEESAPAPALRVKKRKIIELDEKQELGNSDLSGWNANYLTHMQQVLHGKIQARSTSLAKKNADFWVLQNGVGGLNTTFGQEAIPEPLRMFTGNALIEALTGLRFTVAGDKHLREEDGDELEAGTDDHGRRVRSRTTEDEMGRGDDDVMMDDPGYVGDFGNEEPREDVVEQTIEVGREAQTPLAERNSSIMPWNNTASIRGSSARPVGRAPFSAGGFATSSIGGGPIGGLGGVSSRVGSRLVSASPLRGRGDAAATLEPYSDHPMPDLELSHLQGDRSDGSQEQDNQVVAPALDPIEQYEIFGPAANVQTQHANQPAWVRQALDSESINFLSFVQASIQETDAARETRLDALGLEEQEEDAEFQTGSVLFETLLPPIGNSRIVAAQGLLHVLTLATKKMLRAEQDTSFGPIRVRIPELTGPLISTAMAA